MRRDHWKQRSRAAGMLAIASLVIAIGDGCSSHDSASDGSSNSTSHSSKIVNAGMIQREGIDDGVPHGHGAPATGDEQRTDRPTKDIPTLADILLDDVDRGLLSEGSPVADLMEPPKIDEERALRAGIRKAMGKHLTLWTDLPDSAVIDELPRVFDLAVGEWAAYFGVGQDVLSDWHLHGYLMGQDTRFRSAGLFPDDLPPFLHGYARGHELWVREQPSEYYRRHLLLHEGVHGFMSHHLQGMGPPWYREGIAELLATHQWRRGKLTLRVMPKSRNDVPYWGRIKAIQDEFAAGRGLMITEIMQFRSEVFLETTGYAWCWAVAAYLDSHPSTSIWFRRLKHHVTESPLMFNRTVLEHLAPQLRQIDEQWQMFIVNADYGYDFAAMAVDYGVGIPLVDGERSMNISANRGWQCTGIRLEGGVEYSVRAHGRFQVQSHPEAWISEPGGITIRYVRGFPLGILLGAVRLDESRPGITNLANPFPLGLSRNIRPAESGTLYLRINDHPAEIRDNSGEVIVTIRRWSPETTPRVDVPSDRENP